MTVEHLHVDVDFFGFEADEVQRASEELLCDPADAVKELVRDGMRMREWLARRAGRADASLAALLVDRLAP
jgi:hypothetical protein